VKGIKIDITPIQPRRRSVEHARTAYYEAHKNKGAIAVSPFEEAGIVEAMALDVPGVLYDLLSQRPRQAQQFGTDEVRARAKVMRVFDALPPGAEFVVLESAHFETLKRALKDADFMSASIEMDDLAERIESATTVEMVEAVSAPSA
jgi:hypothetical protein